ncbi:hypothetical protein Tco_1380486, partial [Tanacetum coccineum]
IISEVPHSEPYPNNMDNQSVHAMQGFEQTPVVDFPDNEITSDINIILYKERVKTFEQRLNIDLSTREKMIDSQMDDMIKEKLALKQQIDSLEQNLSNQIKEKESLLQTFTVFKNESKEKESKYMDKEIDLEKKIKELDNIVYKVGQSAQTVHMLTKPQVFYDDTHKQALGYQNPFYLKKAQRIKPTLYDGSVISSQHVVIPVIDDEETLILEEDVLLTVMNSTTIVGDSVNVEMQSSESCDKCFDLDAELLKKQNAYNALLKKYFKNNDLKAQLQAKDTTIRKLKDHIKSMRKNYKKEKVKHDMDEIETINIELKHSKNVLDNATTITNATTIALGMFKLVLDPLAPRDTEIEAVRLMMFPYHSLKKQKDGWTNSTKELSKRRINFGLLSLAVTFAITNHCDRELCVELTDLCTLEPMELIYPRAND